MKLFNMYIKQTVILLVVIFLIFPFSPINKPVKVIAIKGNELDLSGCKPAFSDKYNNNTQGVVFNLFEVNSGGKQIKFTASFGGVKEGYVFNFSKFDPRTISTPAPPNPMLPPGAPIQYDKITTNYYVYNGPDGSTLEISLVDDQIASMEIKDYSSSTNTNFKKFAEIFNEKSHGGVGGAEANLISRSCSQEGLFGSALTAPIAFHGTSAPTIDLNGSDTLKRPNLKFTLKRTFNKGGLFTINSDMFIFEATEIFGTDVGKTYYNINDYKNLVIVLVNGSKAFPAKCGDLSTYQDCNDYRGTEITIVPENLQLFYNHVYNGQPKDDSTTCGDVTDFKKADSSDAKKDTDLSDWPSTPPQDCLNVSSAGWLTKWGVVIKNVSVTNPTGAINECGNADNIGTAILVGFCNLTVMFREWAMSFMCFAQNKLVEVLGQTGITSSACTTDEKDPTASKLIN